MKRTNWLVAVAVLAVATAIPAAAQEKKQVEGYIAGGYTTPMSKASDYFTGGWNISGGAILRPAPEKPFGIRFDLGYNDMGASQNLVDIAQSRGLRVDSGRLTMGTLTVDALWEFGSQDHFGGYIGLGIGGYRRYMELTNTVLVPGYICDPWWGWCYPAAVPGDVVAANDTLTKFGYNASVGMRFPVGSGQMFLEARYHYMISDPSTEIIPVLIGYRF
jgi:opacity protein-like surface antigen